MVPEQVETVRLARPDTGGEDVALVTEVLESGQLTMGPLVAEFERELAAACGTRHALAVGRAGRELGLSQPSASRLIAGLEEEVGATLFSRTTRAVTLTDAGAMYLIRVEAILSA